MWVPVIIGIGIYEFTDIRKKRRASDKYGGLMTEKEELQHKITQLEEVGYELNEVKDQMQQIENNSPSGDPTLGEHEQLQRYLELKEVRHTMGNQLMMLQYYQRQLEEIERIEAINAMSYEDRLLSYEHEKKLISSQPMTVKEYEQKIKELAELYNI